jgi:hypothetical protein
MIMKSGERWHCVSPACRCQVLVESSGAVEAQSPRCACGAALKRNYIPPVFKYLDFLQAAPPAASQQPPGER